MPKLKTKSLKTKTVLVVLSALVLGILVYYACSYAGDFIIDKVYLSDKLSEERQTEYVESFKDYVKKNEVKSNDFDMLKKWCKSQKYVYLCIYKNNILYYETDGKIGQTYDKTDGYFDTLDKNNSFKIDFSDGENYISIIEYSEYPYYTAVDYLSIAIGIIVVLIIMLSFNQRLINRAIHLSNEVREVCYGKLEKDIEVSGNDEISELGSDVNEMRQSIIAHYEKEQKALKANNDLITSISHDIRTPLTSLIGYSEMMSDSSVKDIEEIKKYAVVCKLKAYQLKNMTDKLFRYFLVYGNASVDMNVQEYQADDLLEQLLGEYIVELSQNGFNLVTDAKKTNMTISVDALMLKRVFDNIFSNVDKYADKNKDVNVNVNAIGKSILIQVTNAVSDNMHNSESTKIGLQTSKRLMEMLGGKLETTDLKTSFTASVLIRTQINK